MKISRIQSYEKYPTFQSKLLLGKGLKSETLKQAGKCLEEITTDNSNLCMEKKSNSCYLFFIENKLPKQQVGKDTIGFLLAEKEPMEIAKFLKTTIKAIQERAKYTQSSRLTDLNNPDRAAAEIYKKDEVIGKEFMTHFGSVSDGEDLTQAGEIIHVWGI